jgi:hypothetical protein
MFKTILPNKKCQDAAFIKPSRFLNIEIYFES